MAFAAVLNPFEKRMRSVKFTGGELGLGCAGSKQQNRHHRPPGIWQPIKDPPANRSR